MMNFDFTRNLSRVSQDFERLPASQQVRFLEKLENYRYQLQKMTAVAEEDHSDLVEHLNYLWMMLSKYVLNHDSLSDSPPN